MSDARVPVLRGREPELAAIAAAVTSIRQGQAHVVLVEGPPGIGKSALLAETCAMAQRAGVRALLGEAFESQQSVPFAPLLEALSKCEPPVLDPHISRQLGAQADPRYWVMHDLEGALESAAAHSPLAVVIDDIQWSDTGTLVALCSLIAGLGQVPILWVLAARSGRRRSAVTETMTRLKRDGAHRLQVGAVPPAAVAAIVADVLRTGADGSLLALADQAHGNPFLLVELLRGLRDEGRLRIVSGRAAVVGERLPRRLAASMEDRLGGLSDDARQIVRVAAVLPPRFSADQLAAMMRKPPSALVSALDETLQADLLADDGEQLRFRHDLLRHAALETLPRSMRRALQREAVAVLLQAGAAPAEVAMQLAESAEDGDRAAVTTLRLAAQAIAGSDAAAAADLSSRALQLVPPGDPDRGSLVAETVVLLHSAMRSDEARTLGDTALAGVLPPQQEAEVRLSLSTMTARSTVARAHENLRALELPGLQPVTRARHHAWLAYNLAMSGDPAAAVPAAEAAVAAGEATGDLQTQVMSGLSLACIDGARGGCSRALDRVAELRRRTRSADHEPYVGILDFHHANLLAVLGRLDAARSVLVEGVTRARRERNGLLLSIWTQFGGGVSLAAGELSDARAELDTGVQLGDEVLAGTFSGVVQMLTLSQLAAHTGDGEMARAATAAARLVTGDSSPAVRRLAARILAMAAATRGDSVAAVRLLADDPLAPATPLLPNDFGYHPWVARIALAAGDPAMAARAAATAESFERESPGVALFMGVAAHTRGLAVRDSALLVDAARVLAGTQRPLLFAAAAEDAGRALASEGRLPGAIEQLNSAFDAYRSHDATADARRVGRLLRQHGAARRVLARERPDSGWASLTGSELKVVRLIATGATNRSAAEQLFLSPHTVSSHLRSAFAKLGVNSRMQLARVVQDADI
jgi:DNA-binding CsgD family transcriptional regulator